MRAYFVFNLTTAPDVKRVALAHVVYATNWGEVFCRRFTDPPPGLKRRASAFLKTNLAQKVSPGVVMKAYFPKRSQVTRFHVDLKNLPGSVSRDGSVRPSGRAARR